MANEEHLKILQREDWNKWRAGHPDLILDLSSAKLSGAGLSLADLSGADLSWADLSMANLRGADLRGANLSAANLSSTELSEAQLNGANLRGTSLDWANLALANLTQARLARTNFGGASLLNAKGLEECEFGGPCVLDIRTIQKSGKLPLPFLRGCGLPDPLIDNLPSLLQKATQFFSCVISYSHNNEAFAKRLFDTLQGRSIRCWFDEKQLLPGEDIYEPFDRGIPMWDRIVLCCSEASLTSWWVDNEIGKALEREHQLTKERARRWRPSFP